MSLHKHDVGAYTIVFFDKYGKQLKELELVRSNLYLSRTDAETELGKDDRIVSFVIRRNLYNSLD